MPQDPFNGRASGEAAPYQSCLTVTPADGDELPVIPAAIYLPPVLSEEGSYSGTGGQDPHRAYQLRVELMDGGAMTVLLSGFNPAGIPNFAPLSVRRIIWAESNARAVTLVW